MLCAVGCRLMILLCRGERVGVQRVIFSERACSRIGIGSRLFVFYV